jgi:hypothetical protein
LDLKNKVDNTQKENEFVKFQHVNGESFVSLKEDLIQLPNLKIIENVSSSGSRLLTTTFNNATITTLAPHTASPATKEETLTYRKKIID